MTGNIVAKLKTLAWTSLVAATAALGGAVVLLVQGHWLAALIVWVSFPFLTGFGSRLMDHAKGSVGSPPPASWAEEREEFVRDVVPSILAEFPGLDEDQLVKVLRMVVSGMDEMWRGTLRQLAARLPGIADRDPALLPGLRVAAKTINKFVESP